MLENYLRIKNELLSYVEDMIRSNYVDKVVLKNSGLGKLIKDIEGDLFRIALIAPFSAGKSTFINALIGEDLLSTDITAETSVITKIKFAKEPKVEIIYKQDHKSECISMDMEGNPLSYIELKKLLVDKTTVKGINTEDCVKEAIVYYPIDMCKEKVELIDTPGLFARYEKHQDITNSILPKTNAVIFMIDPDSVGEEHFTEVIQNYVRNAKNSSLEKGSKHIFFAINKIDMFEPREIEKAKEELRIVLEGIIEEPQIYELSAYYGLRGKMYKRGKLQLIDIQKDRKISIVDPEDPEFTLSGRSITEKNIEGIIEASNINEIEKQLNLYLEGKNLYILENLKSALVSVLKQSITKLQFEKLNTLNLYKVDIIKYEKKLTALSEGMEILKKDNIDELTVYIDKRVSGVSGQGGILSNIEQKVKKEIDHAAQSIKILIKKLWAIEKITIDKENAEEKISYIVGNTEKELSILSKKIAKESFDEIMREVSSLLEDIQYIFNKVKEDIEKAEIANVGESINDIGSFAAESISTSIFNIIKTEFTEIVMRVSSGLSNRILEVKENSLSKEEKKGFAYRVKRLFKGDKEYLTNFDEVKFQEEMNELIEDLQVQVKILLNNSRERLSKPIIASVENIIRELQNELLNSIEEVVAVKEDLIGNIKQQIKRNEKERDSLVQLKETSIEKNMKVLEQIDKLQIKSI